MSSSTPRLANDQLRWATGLSIIAGLWLLISPFILGYSDRTNAVWDDVILGIAIAIIAALRLWWFSDMAWLSWLNLILGAWVVISPWVLGFSDQSTAMADNVIVGVIVFILSGWAAMTAPGRVRDEVRRDDLRRGTP